MSITKSNKHKLSLDQDKPNEKGGCTLATPYALMRSLILDYQISITPLGSCSPLHSKGVSQLNKWARDLKWMSGICIYTPHSKHNGWGPTQQVSGWSDASVKVTGCTGQCNMSACRKSHLLWPDSGLRPVSTHRMRPVIKNPLWNLTIVDWTLAARVWSFLCLASGLWSTAYPRCYRYG